MAYVSDGQRVPEDLRRRAPTTWCRAAWPSCSTRRETLAEATRRASWKVRHAMLNGTLAEQAAGLRPHGRSRPVRVIAVTSGKGGVGQDQRRRSTCATAHGRAPAREVHAARRRSRPGQRRRHARPARREYNLVARAVTASARSRRSWSPRPAGFRVIPASSGVQTHGRPRRRASTPGWCSAFSEQSVPARRADHRHRRRASPTASCTFTRAAQEVIVVVCDEPASITDAYALIKLLSRDYGHERFRILGQHGALDPRRLRAVRQDRARHRQVPRPCRSTSSAASRTTTCCARRCRSSAPWSRCIPASRAALAFKKLAHEGRHAGRCPRRPPGTLNSSSNGW
ncbi:MAG: hypothetical protein MZV65_54580 [Chromatiales bacterium]|nr:hypothetical protein [Chromatiales bacterium]